MITTESTKLQKLVLVAVWISLPLLISYLVPRYQMVFLFYFRYYLALASRNNVCMALYYYTKWLLKSSIWKREWGSSIKKPCKQVTDHKVWKQVEDGMELIGCYKTKVNSKAVAIHVLATSYHNYSKGRCSQMQSRDIKCFTINFCCRASFHLQLVSILFDH